ncbi:MAG: PQQ-dependent sugar dehydrogenase, partial [Candidatus Caldarchaeum sp.]|nr:PQQ-dependent sugar dehydrogenase [Candidatus Caldarchaeum sp.]
MWLSRRRVLIAGVAAGAAAAAGLVFLPSRNVEREVSLAAEPVAEGLRVPWSISFISDDEALFTERHGSVKLLDLSSRR